jgi:DNA invertase Pin-like site-specific DNA recombinase
MPSAWSQGQKGALGNPHMIDLLIGVPRVSTDTQARDGYSVATQTQALHDYGQRIGARKVVIIPDDISGTTPIRERPGGRKLYDYIDRMPANCAVAFCDVSRVARDVDVFEVVQLMRDLRRAGIEFHITTRGKVDLDDPFAKVLVFMEGAAAANENVMRTRKATENRRAKAAAGHIVGNGKPPYCHEVVGFRRDVDYRVDRERARWMQRAAKRIIAGESTESVARWLQSSGAPLPTVSARGWYQSTLFRILRSPAMIGRFRHGDIVVQRDDLRILDDAAYHAVAAALASHRLEMVGRPVRQYLLRGRVFCSCGRRMTSRPGSSGMTYYSCTSYDRRRLVEPCGQSYVRANGPRGLEALAWDFVVTWCADDARIREGVERHNELQHDHAAPLRDELASADTELGRQRVKLTRLVAALESASDAAAAVIQSQVRAVADRVAELQARCDQLRARIAAPVPEVAPRDVIAMAREVRALLPAATFDQRRRMIEALNVVCRIHGTGDKRKVEITIGILESVAFTAGI